MTREEFDIETEVCSILDDDTKSEQLEKYYIFEVASNRYIYSLEARIAELECARNLSIIRIKELEAPKSCDGCKHNRFGSGSDGIAVDCTSSNGNCARQWYKDYYETKDSK